MRGCPLDLLGWVLITQSWKWAFFATVVEKQEPGGSQKPTAYGVGMVLCSLP